MLGLASLSINQPPPMVVAGMNPFEIDFAEQLYIKNGQLVPAQSVFAINRDSPASGEDVGNRWSFFAANHPVIIDGTLELKTDAENRLFQNTITGTANGVLGQVGSLPQAWDVLGSDGLQWEVVEHGIDDGFGLPYVDVRLSGTNTRTSTAYPKIRFANDVSIGSVGETWSASCYIDQLIVQQAPSIDAVWEKRIRRSSGGYSYKNKKINQPGRHRYVSTNTIGASNPAETDIHSLYFQQAVAAGESIDITHRLSGMQLEKRSEAGPIVLSDGGSSAHLADELILDLPNTPVDLTITSSDATQITFSEVSGPFTYGPVSKRRITSIKGVAT